MEEDIKTRIIVLYDIGVKDNDEDGIAVNNMAHLASELASQQVIVACLDNIQVLLEDLDLDTVQQGDLDKRGDGLIRNENTFLMGLEIDPWVSEIQTVFDILEEWGVYDGEHNVKCIQNRIFCANFENDILNGYTFFKRIPPDLIPDDFLNHVCDIVDDDDFAELDTDIDDSDIDDDDE